MTAVDRRIPALLERLHRARPDARYELDWQTPVQLLVATILAAQCTDERVNRVTAVLFPKYPDARALAEADTAELEEILRPTGYYRQKAKAVQGACAALVERFGGEVPRTVEQLVTLPGVARKTANVVLTGAYRLPSGIIVDTHVQRVARRLGLSRHEDPDKIEADLMRLVPKTEWVFFGPAVVLHGRYTCTAKAPDCPGCPLDDLCDKVGVETSAPASAEEPPTRKPAAVPSASKPRPGASAMNFDNIPASWQPLIAEETAKPYFRDLAAFVAAERAAHTVFPPEPDVFNALRHTPLDAVKVLLLGQDPYHDDGQAHGLCFSVRPGVRPPPSLVNMFKELKSDLGCRVPDNGYLVKWADQGVLMLNAVLTVRAHEANSHKDRGWEKFTDAVIRAVSARPERVVFLLWGGYAQKKEKLIDAARHTVIKCAHPSPLSAAKFFGCKPFSATNAALRAAGRGEIDWQIPDL